MTPPPPPSSPPCRKGSSERSRRRGERRSTPTPRPPTRRTQQRDRRNPIGRPHGPGHPPARTRSHPTTRRCPSRSRTRCASRCTCGSRSSCPPPVSTRSRSMWCRSRVARRRPSTCRPDRTFGSVPDRGAAPGAEQGAAQRCRHADRPEHRARCHRSGIIITIVAGIVLLGIALLWRIFRRMRHRGATGRPPVEPLPVGTPEPVT